jgi:hypothetical protein
MEFTSLKSDHQDALDTLQKEREVRIETEEKLQQAAEAKVAAENATLAEVQAKAIAVEQMQAAGEAKARAIAKSLKHKMQTEAKAKLNALQNDADEKLSRETKIRSELEVKVEAESKARIELDAAVQAKDAVIGKLETELSVRLTEEEMVLREEGLKTEKSRLKKLLDEVMQQLKAEKEARTTARSEADRWMMMIAGRIAGEAPREDDAVMLSARILELSPRKASQPKADMMREKPDEPFKMAEEKSATLPLESHAPFAVPSSESAKETGDLNRKPTEVDSSSTRTSAKVNPDDLDENVSNQGRESQSVTRPSDVFKVDELNSRKGSNLSVLPNGTLDSHNFKDQTFDFTSKSQHIHTPMTPGSTGSSSKSRSVSRGTAPGSASVGAESGRLRGVSRLNVGSRQRREKRGKKDPEEGKSPRRRSSILRMIGSQLDMCKPRQGATAYNFKSITAGLWKCEYEETMSTNAIRRYDVLRRPRSASVIPSDLSVVHGLSTLTNAVIQKKRAKSAPGTRREYASAHGMDLAKTLEVPSLTFLATQSSKASIPSPRKSPLPGDDYAAEKQKDHICPRDKSGICEYCQSGGKTIEWRSVQRKNREIYLVTEFNFSKPTPLLPPLEKEVAPPPSLFNDIPSRRAKADPAPNDKDLGKMLRHSIAPRSAPEPNSPAQGDLNSPRTNPDVKTHTQGGRRGGHRIANKDRHKQAHDDVLPAGLPQGKSKKEIGMKKAAEHRKISPLRSSSPTRAQKGSSTASLPPKPVSSASSSSVASGSISSLPNAVAGKRGEKARGAKARLPKVGETHIIDDAMSNLSSPSDCDSFFGHDHEDLGMSSSQQALQSDRSYRSIYKGPRLPLVIVAKTTNPS